MNEKVILMQGWKDKRQEVGEVKRQSNMSTSPKQVVEEGGVSVLCIFQILRRV